MKAADVLASRCVLGGFVALLSLPAGIDQTLWGSDSALAAVGDDTRRQISSARVETAHGADTGCCDHIFASSNLESVVRGAAAEIR